MSAHNDGGPAFPCRKCSQSFLAKPYQIANGDYECPACKRERQNAINARRDLSAHAKARYAQPEVKAAYRAYHERKKADPEYRLKRSARRKVSTEIEAGRLKRNPCEICGSPKTDAHHNDYHRPLEVRWLCRLHHFQEEHRANTPPV